MKMNSASSGKRSIDSRRKPEGYNTAQGCHMTTTPQINKQQNTSLCEFWKHRGARVECVCSHRCCSGSQRSKCHHVDTTLISTTVVRVVLLVFESARWCTGGHPIQVRRCFLIFFSPRGKPKFCRAKNSCTTVTETVRNIKHQTLFGAYPRDGKKQMMYNSELWNRLLLSMNYLSTRDTWAHVTPSQTGSDWHIDSPARNLGKGGSFGDTDPKQERDWEGNVHAE